jgi:hypothetical protein
VTDNHASGSESNTELKNMYDAGITPDKEVIWLPGRLSGGYSYVAWIVGFS